MSRNNDNFNQNYPGDHGEAELLKGCSKKSPHMDVRHLLDDDPAYQLIQDELDRHWWEEQNGKDK